jgi:hypothetical protein
VQEVSAWPQSRWTPTVRSRCGECDQLVYRARALEAALTAPPDNNGTAQELAPRRCARSCAALGSMDDYLLREWSEGRTYGAVRGIPCRVFPAMSHVTRDASRVRRARRRSRYSGSRAWADPMGAIDGTRARSLHSRRRHASQEGCRRGQGLGSISTAGVMCLACRRNDTPDSVTERSQSWFIWSLTFQGLVGMGFAVHWSGVLPHPGRVPTLGPLATHGWCAPAADTYTGGDAGARAAAAIVQPHRSGAPHSQICSCRLS